jgi:hypothetical protein
MENNSNTMILNGKTIPYARETIQTANCELDPRNPRIQYLVGQRAGSVSEAELDGLIWEKDSVKALAASILQNGGVYEQVIVQRNGERFRVREGNCRTVACRHLLEQYPEDPRFSILPAMIFDVELTEEDLAVLLADMHVAGKIRWEAYEQAKHVYDLSHVYGKPYEWLSNHLRLSKSKIVELLSAYTSMTEFLTANPSPVHVKKFSFFHELMRKKDLREKFNEEPQFKPRFHKWLIEERITDSKQVRELAPILENTAASEALDSKGFNEAKKILTLNDPSLDSDLFRAVKHATEKLRSAPMNEVSDLMQGNVQKIIMLRNLHRAIADLATLAKITL